jgi:hypothetical protein
MTLPLGCVPNKTDAVSSSTLAGNLSSSLHITMTDVRFPEFFKSRFIDNIEAMVFESKCRYDAIIGRNALQRLGLILNFKTQFMQWDECIVKMRMFPHPPALKPSHPEPSAAEQLFLDLLEDDIEHCECGCSDDATAVSPVEVHLLNDELSGSDEGNDHAGNDAATEAQKLGYKSKTILPSKYDGASIEEVMRGCIHLSQAQQKGII